MNPVLAAALALLLAVPARAFPSAGAGHPRMVDAVGDTLPEGPWPRRIISLSPNLTEILFAVGVDTSRIAGVTRYCDYPPEARRRPNVGGIVDPSLEEIQLRRPDVVLAARGNPVQALERIRALGFPVFAFDDRTDLRGIERIIAEVIELAGPEDSTRAFQLLHRVRTELQAYQAWSDTLTRRPEVYYADPQFPEWTAGKGSHVDDLIRLAGGRNVVEATEAWPQYSVERLLMAQPDFLLFALPAGADRPEIVSTLAQRPGWADLRALRNPGTQICWVDAGLLQRPGPRVFDALKEVAACLHPGAAP
jgi:iron complex transport system substrate-binding protein